MSVLLSLGAEGATAAVAPRWLKRDIVAMAETRHRRIG
jgi:hypothetical protein